MDINLERLRKTTEKVRKDSLRLVRDSTPWFFIWKVQWLNIPSRRLLLLLLLLLLSLLFPFGARAPSGPGPPHSRGF